MKYLAIAMLASWGLYSWQIAAALGAMCMVIALFYSAALTGETEQKIVKTFFVLVLVMSLMMLAILTQNLNYDDEIPKICNSVQC